MGTSTAVIDELRAMFKEGATPSRLIQHVVARHPDERNWYGLIQDYFREAFGVQIVRGLSPSEHYDDISMRYAYLNEDVLHEIVQKRPEWDQELNDSQALSWLGALAAKDTAERIQELESNESPELVDSWNRVSDKDRATIIRITANLNSRIEMCHILARLAERLQQQVLALERKQTAPVGLKNATR
jgi:hypothetical protein